RRAQGDVFLAGCVSRRSADPGDRRQLVPRNRADVAGDVCLSALQRQQVPHHRAPGRLRRAGDQLRSQQDRASRRGLAGELSLLGGWLTWLEVDEIRGSKDGWMLEARSKNGRRVGESIGACLVNKGERSTVRRTANSASRNSGKNRGGGLCRVTGSGPTSNKASSRLGETRLVPR